MDYWINMEHLCYYKGKKKQKHSEKSLSQGHSINHKPHMAWYGIEHEFRYDRPATNHMSHGTVNLTS
jgi:hypothetical protein